MVIKDSQSGRRPQQVTAQVTIWDVLTAYISEDGVPGDFRVGQRFIVSPPAMTSFGTRKLTFLGIKVTNLDPNNTGAWMGREDGAVIYLIARRDTRWRKAK